VTPSKSSALTAAPLARAERTFFTPTAPGGAGAGSKRHRTKPRRAGVRRRPLLPLRAVTSNPAPVLLRFVQHIPWWVWLIVALALAVAAIAGAGALRASVLARRQRLALASVTAEALIDPLTGVLNRRGFIDAAERELARAQRYGRPFALAYADVRGLKAVNDTQGHLAGDALIRQATGLLEDSARADDVVGRLGGDEFGLLLVEQAREGAIAVTSRIRETLPARRAELGLEMPWDLTIGTAVYPDDGNDIDELLRAADRRLYAQRGITLT
jgi:diguanylate cyclase (GGDEF)-like protein